MRIKFGRKIVFARFVTHNEHSSLFNVHTWKDGELYTVSVDEPEEEIERMWDQLLIDGWIDFSNYEYSN